MCSTLAATRRKCAIESGPVHETSHLLLLCTLCAAIIVLHAALITCSNPRSKHVAYEPSLCEVFSWPHNQTLSVHGIATHESYHVENFTSVQVRSPPCSAKPRFCSHDCVLCCLLVVTYNQLGRFLTASTAVYSLMLPQWLPASWTGPFGGQAHFSFSSRLSNMYVYELRFLKKNQSCCVFPPVLQ